MPTTAKTWNTTSSLRTELPKAKLAVKKSVNEEILETWNNKVQKLLVQGEFTKLLIEQEESVTWQSIIRGLPRNILAFAARLATDSLPSPSNLKKVGGKSYVNLPSVFLPPWNTCPHHKLLPSEPEPGPIHPEAR